MNMCTHTHTHTHTDMYTYIHACIYPYIKKHKHNTHTHLTPDEGLPKMNSSFKDQTNDMPRYIFHSTVQYMDITGRL